MSETVAERVPMRGERRSDVWRQVTCAEREELVNRPGGRYDGLAPFSSLTDPDGQYGEPCIFTEWGEAGTDIPVLRDYRWPRREMETPDATTCEHFAFAALPLLEQGEENKTQ